MTPVALVGLLVAASALAPAPRAPDKISCVLAHESAQDFQQRSLLTQAREKLLFCSDPRCPRLVADECQTLLAELDRPRASNKADEETSAPSASQASPDAASNASTAQAGANAAVPAPTPQAPPTVAPCCALGQQPAPQQIAPSMVRKDMSPPRASPPRERPITAARPTGAWRAPLVTGSLTVVALAGAAYFGWRGLSGAEQLGRTCSPECDPAQVTPIRRQLLAADLSLLAGVGLGALTAWTIWQGGSRESGGAPAVSGKRRGEPTRGAGWSVVPRLGSLQVEYGGHF